MIRSSLLMLFFIFPCIASETADKAFTSCNIRNESCSANQLDDATWYTVIIKNVAEGKLEWINKIPVLQKDADRKRNLDLLTAAKLGLVINPGGILAMLKPLDKQDTDGFAIFSTESVCDSSMGWVTEESYQKYYRAVYHSVQKLGDEGRHCLKILEANHEEIISDASRSPDSWGINIIPGY